MNWAEQIFGTPLAAPETVFMRRLRFVFIGSAGATLIGILAIEVVVAVLGRAGAGACLLVLLLIAASSGFWFFFRKIRIDDAWLADRDAEREGNEP
ncbi:MAG: hypothetical protein V7676_15195 [Parasphingorhabdus sp.]|jgi:hypothetical protein|uniref:hypothetical protein n=1 Tax=Parasphingorhabdus sp. TaxID=2709688 RepID=UPI003002CF0F|tara:strand:+ start:87 stop:374 length:288 start_codon:yes stop_codon:yes gene_type:complete